MNNEEKSIKILKNYCENKIALTNNFVKYMYEEGECYE